MRFLLELKPEFANKLKQLSESCAICRPISRKVLYPHFSLFLVCFTSGIKMRPDAMAVGRLLVPAFIFLSSLILQTKKLFNRSNSRAGRVVGRLANGIISSIQSVQ